MKNTGQTLGQRLAIARENLNMTQEELARLSRVPRNTIQNIEYDKVSPRLDNLNALASILKISLDELANSKTNQPHFDPDWPELARILHALTHAEPVTRLAALLLLTGEKTYSDQLRAIPGGAPFASVLAKLPR